MAARPRDFRILGALEVVEDGKAVALGGRRQRALLALLLLNPNETLSTARLIDELWGEQPPASAAKTVQVTVSRLRKALGHDADGLVVTRDRGYELRTDPDRIDAHRFERLFASGTRELAAGRPQSAAANLEAAVALWRGPALAELADQPFARHDIARLDDLRIACLEELTDAKLALGRHAEVAGELEGLIGEHPYRERLRAQLMLALYRADRQADALQAYQDARATLVEDLGIDPSERLRDLERAVLAQDPALLLPVAPPRPAPRHPSRGVPLVGRSRELEALTGGLQEAIAGHGGVCLVAGEPGIGKSRLAEELTGQARERGVRVLVGRCWEAGGAPAYWPWVQALRTYLRDAEPGLLRAQLGRDGPYLATILPEVREVVPDLPAAPALDSEGARFHLLEAVAAFLRSIASAGPIALFLDDLHAADAPSLLLLRFVAGDLAGAPILVVGCYRDTEVGPELRDALAVLAREPAVRRITLGGLSGADTSRLLELTMGAGPAADLAERVQAETQGNPLFSTEIARLIASQGDAGDSGRRLPIPEGVSEAIGRRLESRSDACRALLTVASVVGREFDPEVVGRVSEIEDDDILLAVDEAAAARLVEGSPEGGGRLRFSHILVRDTLYEGLPAPRRARLHRSLAEVLETSYAGNLDPHVAELAYHYGEGGTAVAAKALDYARRAGSRAAAQFGHEEAARHYLSALRIAETTGTGDAQTTCELLVALGEAQSRAGNGPEAKRTLHRAAMLAEQEGRPDLLTRAALGYGGRFAWARSSSDPALVPLLDRALAAVGEEDSRERARLLGRLATAYRDEPIRDHRARLGAEAVEIATRLGDPETLADALQGQFIAIEGPDIAGSGLDVTARLIALADQTGDKERAFQGHDHRIHIFWQRGERAALDVELDEIARLAEELGNRPSDGMSAPGRRCWRSWRAGSGRLTS